VNSMVRRTGLAAVALGILAWCAMSKAKADGLPDGLGAPDSAGQLSLGRVVTDIARDAGEVCGVVLGGHGRVVVCGRRGQLEVYDSAGGRVNMGFAETAQGEQFHALTRIAGWPSDSLVAIDARGVTATILDQTGRVVRRFKYDNPPGTLLGLAIHGLFEDGTALASYYRVKASTAADRFAWFAEEGPVTESAEYVRLRIDGYDGVGRFPAGGEYRVRYEGSGAVLVHPLANRRLTAVGDSFWFVAFSDTPAVNGMDGDGRIVRRIRLSPRPKTRGDRRIADDLVKAFVEGASGQQAAFRKRLVSLDRRQSLPEVDALLAGPDGEVWVGYVGAQANEREWRVYDRAGNMVGVLAVPRGFQLVSVGVSRAVVVDDDGGTVRVYELRR